MTTLHANLMGDERFREDDQGGSATVGYHIEGIPATTAKNNKLLTSSDIAGLPRMFERHPREPNLVVQSREIEAVEGSPEQAKVTIDYRNFALVKFGFGLIPGVEPPVISVSTSVRTELTNKSVTGDQFIILHTFDRQKFNVKTGDIVPQIGDAFRGGVVFALGPLDVDQATGIVTVDITVEQVGEFSLQVPYTTVTYRRAEIGSPGGKAKLFVGTINKRPIFGDPAHFWLCTRLDGESRDGGTIYDVVYEFQRNRLTWNPDANYFDPEIGGFIPGAAIVGARIYIESDFRRLDLKIGIDGIKVGL